VESIPWVIIGLVWILNFAISWFNARTVGMVWVETKQIGGWQRFMTWMGAIMSASGFTWCYLIVLLFGAYYLQPGFLKPGQAPYLTPDMVLGGLSLGYLIILPGILFSGMMIWIDSLIQAWRRRDLPSIGVAAWNTFAQVHNTYGAYKGASGAWESVGKLFKGGNSNDAKGKGVLLIVLLVILALLGGVLTTWSIVSHYAATVPLPTRRNRV